MSRKPIDISGQKFGKLTAISRIPGTSYWFCSCECGKTTKTYIGQLSNGHSKSCGCGRRSALRKAVTKERIGKRYGKLSVIDKIEQEDYPTIWICLCDCGTRLEYTWKDFANNPKSCGCSRGRAKQKRKLDNPYSCSEDLYETYGRGARHRNYSFNLTLEEFREITSRPCHYCGEKPNQKTRTRIKGVPYVFNGIDRKDNTEGYSIENCLPCCDICNKAKRDLSYNAFLEWISKLTTFNEILRS